LQQPSDELDEKIKAVMFDGKGGMDLKPIP
jgi:hypothetical protein